MVCRKVQETWIGECVGRFRRFKRRESFKRHKRIPTRWWTGRRTETRRRMETRWRRIEHWRAWKRIADSRGRGPSKQTEAVEEIHGGGFLKKVSPSGKKLK
ncbi:hypothetical protein Bca4012_054485 [Brassica carinata]